MVHAWVSDEYINLALMYMTNNIFPVISIKNSVNQNGKTNTPHKLETGTKLSVSNLHVLFYPCVLRKSAAHIDTKELNMHHQSKRVFELSSLEYHNIKKSTLSTYLVHRRYFLHMTLYFTKTIIVR